MRLKVVNLNIWMGGIIYQPMVKWLQDQHADVYLFQEVFHSEDDTLAPIYRSHRALQAALKMEYAEFAPAFIESVGGFDIPQGNSVISRFPLTTVAIDHFDIPYGPRSTDRSQFHLIPRNLQHVALTVGQTSVQVLNTQGIWGEDGKDNPRRLAMGKQIAAVAAKAKTAGPVILAGDFNVRPDTETISYVEAELRNVFKGELTTTFNLARKNLTKYPGYATAAVDMFFASEDVTILSHECPQVDVSDHLPLVMDIEIAD